MIWNINIIVPFIAFFLYAGLIILVVVSRPQTASRRSFRLFLLSMASWSLSAFFLLVDVSRAHFWMKMLSSSAITVMVTLYYFVETIIETRARWARYLVFYMVISIGLTLFSDLVIEYAVVVDSVVDWDFGPLILFIAPSYLIMLYSIYLLINNYQDIEDPNQKNRLLYLTVAVSLIIFGSIVNFTDLGKYPLDIAANGLSALIIAYSILRHQLLDIRVVIRQGLLYSIPTVIIGTTYFLIITLFLNIFHFYSGVEIFLTSLVVAVITALVAEPLRIRAQAIIDRMFFREKYNSSQMLQTLSGSVAAILDIYKITSMILDEVCSTLHIPMAAFFLRDQVTSRFQLTTQI
ncbi:MAG TPA: hypothetical protein ENF22_01655, partial [Chloroflexi bacterium]|nr:hypothetical protein [Chloroflexota bacterium]